MNADATHDFSCLTHRQRYRCTVEGLGPYVTDLKGMKMSKTILAILGSVILVCTSLVHAQQLGKVPRIGYLSGSSPSGSASLLEGFRQGLQDHGYIEGKNIQVEYRFAEGKVDRIPTLVAELVQLNVDVFASSNFTAISATKKATRTIPIVMVTTQDPVRHRDYQ